MLRTNLSTRPFYNVRAVKAAVVLLAVVVAVLTAFNMVEILRLTAAQRSLGARASDYEAQAVRMRQEAAQLRAKVDTKELAVVSAAAREANTVIDRRVFSWTDLMAQFEATLPEDVRITAVSPRTQQGRLIIDVAVEARTIEDLDAFVEALEETGSFRDVLPAEQRPTDEGLVEAIVQGEYTQPSRAAEPASSDTPAATVETPGRE